jgi:ubiquinone/menaquinone biosynthesis C-methylase UbiE
VRGADPSEERVRKATARVGLDPEGRIAFKAGRPGSLPFPDGFFDLVATIDTRLHAGETARVLKPGGYVILATSRRSRGFFRTDLKRLGSKLERREFEPVEIGEAGDGAFYVGRLAGA